MTELKTSKELEQKALSTMRNSNAVGYSFSLMRHEAIKWIKELDRIETSMSLIDVSKQKIFECVTCEGEGFERNCDSIIKWIKHFFNIKDEDLDGCD